MLSISKNWRKSLSNLGFSRKQRKKAMRRAALTSRSLQMESLEDRIVLTTGLSSFERVSTLDDYQRISSSEYSRAFEITDYGSSYIEHETLAEGSYHTYASSTIVSSSANSNFTGIAHNPTSVGGSTNNPSVFSAIGHSNSAKVNVGTVNPSGSVTALTESDDGSAAISQGRFLLSDTGSNSGILEGSIEATASGGYYLAGDRALLDVSSRLTITAALNGIEIANVEVSYYDDLIKTSDPGISIDSISSYYNYQVSGFVQRKASNGNYYNHQIDSGGSGTLKLSASYEAPLTNDGDILTITTYAYDGSTPAVLGNPGIAIAQSNSFLAAKNSVLVQGSGPVGSTPLPEFIIDSGAFPIDGDFNGDGETDEDDFDVFLEQLAPPKITDIIFSSATSGLSHSMKDYDGTGDQLTPLDIGTPDKVEIVFNKNIDASSISASDLNISGILYNANASLSNFSFDGTNTASWDISGLSNNTFLLSLDDSITDLFGNSLDGEWTNPQFTSGQNNGSVSTFETMGDGEAGGDFNFVFNTYILGELNGTGPVDGLDLGILLGYWNPYSDTGTQTFNEADLNGDGWVDGLDLGILLGNWQVGNSVILFADLDGDGEVEQSERDLIFTNSQSGGMAGTFAQGDVNGDGWIDSKDLALADLQLGMFLDLVDNS